MDAQRHATSAFFAAFKQGLRCINPIFLHCLRFFLCYFVFAFCLQTAYAEDEISESLANSILHNEEDEVIETEVTQAKILKLATLTDIEDLSEQTLYVGQYITITYQLILLDRARIVYTEFSTQQDQQGKKKNTQTVEVVKEGEWQRENDYLSISYTFKILQPKVTIPALVVHVQNSYIQDSMQTEPIALQAQNLSADGYSGVVAEGLQVVDYTLENYDDTSNMILIELQGNASNLEDFRLPHIKEQEFGQNTKFSPELAHASILARIPKELQSIDFSYFDIKKHDFVGLSIPNTINIAGFDDELKEDLNPKSSFLRIGNILLLILLGIFLLLTLIKRSYVAAVFSCVLFGVIVYGIFANTQSITTLPNARVLIQPTHTATELFVIANPTKLEAIDKKNNYYKVNIDSKVGWISRNETNKR